MIAATAGTASTGVITWATGTGANAFLTLAGAQGWNIPMKIGEVPQGALVIHRRGSASLAVSRLLHPHRYRSAFWMRFERPFYPFPVDRL